VGANEPSTETGVGPVPEPVRTDRSVRTEQPVTGRGQEPGTEPVQPQLGRVPGLLERRVSAAERKAFDREVKALKVIENNWKEQTNGENYRSWLGARRQSGLLQLVDGVLRPQTKASSNH
jgi:hypothetical protein